MERIREFQKPLSLCCRCLHNLLSFPGPGVSSSNSSALVGLHRRPTSTAMATVIRPSFTSLAMPSSSNNCLTSITASCRSRSRSIHLSRGCIDTRSLRVEAAISPADDTGASRIPSLRFYTTGPGNSSDEGKLNLSWWQRVLIVSGVAGIAYFLLQDAVQNKELESEKVRYKEFDKAKLGGDWELTDHHGNKRSSTDFRGHWMLVYFGFTHCPDICPEELEKLAHIVKIFDENPKLPNMQPIFITVDPERDSPAVIKDYLSDFKSPRLVGFTGTEDEIRQIAKKFRVYFGKGPKDEDNDYIVDHTIIIYLVNPKGEFVNYFGRSMNAEKITESITNHVNKYNELHMHETSKKS